MNAPDHKNAHTIENLYDATDLITDEVLKRYQNTPDPRLREIMLSLIKHIHSFAKEVKLSASEWAYAMQLFEETGKFCGPG
ncbi:MAG: dioxygenase, partial [Limnohabitans sp.]